MSRSKLSEKYEQAFTTPTGKDVLADLRAQFYDTPRLAANSPHETVIRAAQRDVVQYVLDLVEGLDE